MITPAGASDWLNVDENPGARFTKGLSLVSGSKLRLLSQVYGKF